MGNFLHDKCAGKVREIQNFHMDGRGWSDIAYNTITCPHGYIFEGRGWGIRSAANGTNTGNAISYAHCYLSGDGDPFTDEARTAMRAIIDTYRSKGSGGAIWPHQHWHSTACPGPAIKDWIGAGVPAGPEPAPAPDPVPSPDPTPSIDPAFAEKVRAMPVLSRGASGQYVKVLQALLCVAAMDLCMWFSKNDIDKWIDGTFGETTEYVLKEWQKRTNSLDADGVCGPATWAWLVGV